MGMEKNRTRIWRGTEQEHEEGQIKRNGEGHKDMKRDQGYGKGHTDMKRDATRTWRGTQGYGEDTTRI